MYTASPFVRSVVSIVTGVSLMVASFVPVLATPQIATAAQGTLLEITCQNVTINGNTWTFSGTWTAFDFPGLSNQYDAAVAAPTGTFVDESSKDNPDTFSIVTGPADSQGGPQEDMTGTWSNEVVFNTAPTSVTATLYHGKTAGNEISPDDTCTFVLPPQITLLKTVVNNNSGTSVDTDFTLSASGPVNISGVEGNANVTNKTVVAGAYTLSESGPAGYTASLYSCVKNNTAPVSSNSISLVDGDVATCTITNDDNAPTTATLTLQKTVVNNSGGDAEDTDWTLSAAGPTPISGTEGQAAITSAVVNPGSYDLSETDGPAGYAPSAWVCSGTGNQTDSDTIALDAGETATCVITNNDIPPTIKVVKSVVNDNGGDAVETDFTFKLDDAVSMVHDTAVETLAGLHEVSEDFFTGYEASVWGGDCDTDGSITLALDQDATCTIENDDQQSYIIVDKTVVNDDGGEAEANDFLLTVDGNAVSDEEAYAVNPGEHTVSETNLDGYSAGVWGGDCDENGDVTVAQGETATCTITNNDIAPGLTLHKTVTNDNGGDAEPSDFQAFINDNPVDWEDTQVLDAGAYTLTESELSGYEAGDWECDGGSLDGNIVTIEVGETVECTIVNDDVAPTITLTKEVINDNGGTAGSNDFGLVIGATAVGSGDTLEVNANTDIAINELGLDGYLFVSISGDEGCPLELGDTVSLSEGQNLNCTITNDDIAPTLTLEKFVDNGEQGDESPSAWLLTATGDQGEPFILQGEGGASSDGTFVAGTYTLSESGPDHFAAGQWSCVTNNGDPVEGNVVEIGLGDDVYCSIVNTFTPFSSDISVTKTVDDETPNANQQVVYTLTVSNAGPDTANNVEVADLLPAGATYVSDDGAGAYNSGTGVWAVGSLANGASATLHITATASANEGDVVNNAASVTSSTADPDSEDNSDSASFTVNVTPQTPVTQCNDGLDNDGDDFIDLQDPGCEDNPLKDDEGDSDNGGGGGGQRVNRPAGEVLGATTEECSEYLFEYIKKGANNNPVEVTKLQQFLNNFEAFNLSVNGIYDDASYNAVHAFQTKYLNDIMIPWGATRSSGYVYYTTKKKINEIYCQFTKEFPLTSQQEAEIARVRALGEAWQSATGSTGSSVGGQVTLPSSAPSAPASPASPAAPTTPEVGSSNQGSNSQAASPAESGQGGSWWSNFWNWLTGN